PAGDSTDDTSEETTEISTETTRWWQTKPTMPDRSDIESFLTDISNRVTRPEESTMPPVETKPEPTAPPDTEEPGTAAPENNAPAAAIGFGS
ncbi:MAG TPA: hypothetical protein DEF14_05440, partial [Ruminococcaceae bacterium]|nr:hypothetical protein [Oscillospiraceae bacterium]